MRCHALVLIYNLVAQSKAEPTLESEQSDKLHSSSKIRASLGVVNTFLPGSRDGTGFPVYCDAQPSATHPTEENTNDACHKPLLAVAGASWVRPRHGWTGLSIRKRAWAA
jgi:hypothetical protein